jgi:hypothetical protein
MRRATKLRPFSISTIVTAGVPPSSYPWGAGSLPSPPKPSRYALTYAGVCVQVDEAADNSHAGVCWRMLAYGCRCTMLRRYSSFAFMSAYASMLRRHSSFAFVLAFADICWRMLAYGCRRTRMGRDWCFAAVCWRMLTYADVCRRTRVGREWGFDAGGAPHSSHPWGAGSPPSPPKPSRYADVCWRMLTYGVQAVFLRRRSPPGACACTHLTCGRMLTYAGVCVQVDEAAEALTC